MKTSNVVRTPAATDFVVIGVDPGPRPGICGLRYSASGVRSAAPIIIQCSANIALLLILSILPSDVERIFLSYEPWVTGNRSSKLSTPAAGAVTSQMCGVLEGLKTKDSRIIIRHHQASAVKPWGCAERLQRAGLQDLVIGMTHARDGAKQALYCAVHDAGVSDPLSKRHKLIEVPV